MPDSNWKRVSRDEHCPICGKPDWCTVTTDGMIACCMRVEAEKQAANGGWIHNLSDTPRPFVISYAPTSYKNPKASPAVLDKVYSAMLSRLTLSEVHRDELTSPKRGMTLEQIKKNAYSSLPLQGRSQVAKDLLEIFEVDKVTHVPGFYLNDNGHSGYYPTLAGAPGLLIPIRDVQQRILAFQIKTDIRNSEVSETENTPTHRSSKRPRLRFTHSPFGKYTWFSSKGKEGGTSSGAPAHVAMPSSLIDKKRVWITEGALKADIACELLGEIVIGVSGVSNFRAGNVLTTLEQLDGGRQEGKRARGQEPFSRLAVLPPMEVVIAYDADKDKNPHVKHHAFQLACACSAKGYTVYEAQWDLHKGKGIDDLLLNGEIPTITLWRTKNRIQKLNADFMEEVIIKEGEVKIPLNEARQKHYEQIRALIENHPQAFDFRLDLTKEVEGVSNQDKDTLRTQPNGVHAFTSVFGTGKTSGAMNAIKDLFKEDKWPTVKRKRKNKKTGKYYYRDEPLRVVFVTDNHAAYQQWLLDDELKEIVEIQQGRSPDEKSQWYCERFQECHNHGAKRHNPMVDVCQECLLQHATLVGDRMVEYWQCPYLLSMDRVKAAKVVFTSKASIFNASQELKDFDVIIVDEDLFSSLWEIVTFNTYNLNDYLSGMDVIITRQGSSIPLPALASVPACGWAGDREYTESIYPPDDDFRVFINLLKEVMATPVNEYNFLPAVPLMKEIAQKNRIDLKELLCSLEKREVHYQTQRYDFEAPFSLHDRTVYPIRLMRDLMGMILAEIDRPDDADTRIWLTLEGIKLYIPRQHLIDIIQRGKTVINLDATPNILLNVLFPQITFYKYDVEEYLKVTQVTNSLYTKSNIAARNYANLHKINEGLEKITHNATCPVVFSHKAFDPQIEGNIDNANVFSVSNRNALYGHFDYDTRAVNGYADTDVLCIVGHYSKPISHLRALAQAVRNEENVVEKNNPTQVLRPYWYRNKDGCGFGRWCQADPDPLVQELIIQSEYAIYTQAIGRGRAALRSAEKPLQVYLITATPIDSLHIDKLVRLSDLTNTKPNKEKFYARRDELNKERKKTAYQKVVSAIKQLLAEGKQITLNAIEKLCGVKRTLIAKLRKEIIRMPHLSEASKSKKVSQDVGFSPTITTAEGGIPKSEVRIPNSEADRGEKCEIKMGILGEGCKGVTTVGYNISKTPQWTPPITLDNTTKKKPIDACDNFYENSNSEHDDKLIFNENITPTLDSELAAWAYKKHGFSLEKIIRAYEEGFSLKEPITIREGLIVDDFCGFVEKRFSKIKDLDSRLPRLKGYVLEYANNLRVECMKDLSALTESV